MSPSNVKVLFVGAINISNSPFGGEEYKNQLILEKLMLSVISYTTAMTITSGGLVGIGRTPTTNILDEQEVITTKFKKFNYWWLLLLLPVIYKLSKKR